MSSFLSAGSSTFLFTIGGGNSLIFYVAIGGSDSDTGLSPAHAWATIQHAFNYIAANVFFAGGTAIVNIGSGTFVGGSTKAAVGGGTLQMYGNGSANTTITDVGGTCITMSPNPGYVLGLNAVTFSVPNFGAGLNISAEGASFVLGDAFGSATGDIVVTYNGFAGFASISGHSHFGTSGSTGTGQGVIKFNGNISQSINLRQSAIYADSFTWNVFGNGTNSPSFITSEAQSLYDDLTALVPNYTVVSGAITGPRFTVTSGASIGVFLNNLGTNYFPGDTAGIGDRISGYDGYVIPPIPNTQTAAYTLALTDIAAVVEGNVTNPTTLTITVPTNASVAFPIGSQVTVQQVGTGTVIVAAAGGVTGDNFGSLASQWSSALLRKRGTNEWVMTLV